MRTCPGGVALLVGVDRYPLLEAKYQLPSCANDARLVAEVLRGRFDFPESGVELLLDEAATRDGILASLAALRGRARPGAQPTQVSALVTDLERLARCRNLLRLADEDLGNPLRGCLEVQLLCRQPDGEFRAAPADPLAGGAVYHEGERLALRIVQRFAAPLYLHVLDLGLSGAIAPMFPVAGANEALEPGRELLIGVRPGDEMTVRLPEAFANLMRARGLTPVAGREFLKVFATTHEADLTWWRQPGFGAERGGRALASRLDRVLWRVMHGARLRDDAPARAGEHWTVVTLDFLVRASIERVVFCRT